MAGPGDENRRSTVIRVRRHWRWAREQGIGRLIEEDQLNLLSRAARSQERRRWRRAHGLGPGTATPVFLVGLQRSGTNMVVRGLERCPEFEVHNENDRRVFDRFQLRHGDQVWATVAVSRHRYVLFKPLCDSHRVADLLDDGQGRKPAFAIWVYRSVDGRVRSALAKFGDANLRALRAIASGEGDGRWEAQRLSKQSLELIGSFDYDRMSPASAAALFWCVRNSLYFELGLHERPDTLLSSYDALVRKPEETMQAVCEFLGFPYSPELVSHVRDRQRTTNDPLPIDPRIRRACTDLQARLDAASDAGRP